MHTRPARPSDFSAIASISVRCFSADPLYLYTNPGLHTYPLSFRAFFVLRTHLRFYTPGYHFEVAVTDEGDEVGNTRDDKRGGEELAEEGKAEKSGRIVGYTCWIREGTDASAAKWQKQSLYSRLNYLLNYCHLLYNELLSIDCSLSPSNLHTYLSSATETYPADSIWVLQNLCTHPTYQRRGVGAMLLQWGKDKAKVEGVMVGLTSSPIGEGLYRREGFREIERLDGGVVGEVPVMVWEWDGHGEGEGMRKREVKEGEEVEEERSGREKEGG